MWTLSASALLALGLAVQQATATGWTDATTYRNPSNTNNQCIGDQPRGLGFDDRSTGDLGNYGSLTWQNLKCTDGLEKRTSGPHESGSHGRAPKGFAGGRCASGQASKDVETSPRFSCGSEQKGMSIDHIHVSTSEETEIELHYGYDNGDVCKQTETCSPAGKIIKNHQCGDAKSVTVKLPDTDKKDKCEVGIHSVGFNCGPSSKPPIPSSTPVSSTPVGTAPVTSTPPDTTETKPYPYPTANTTLPGPTTAPSSAPETTPTSSTFTSGSSVPIPSTTLESTTTPIYSNTSTTSSTTPVETIPTTTPLYSNTTISSTSPGETIPPTTVSGSTVPVVTTQVIVTTLTTCPVTHTVTSGSSTSVEITSTVSTVTITSTSTVCTYCVPPASTSEVPTVPPIPETSTSPPISETSAVPSIPETSITPPIPETTPIASSTGNSPETPTSAISVPSSSSPIPTITQAVVTTEVIQTTLTTCPVTNTITSGDVTSVQIITTVSTITSTSTSTICTQCAPPPPASETPSSLPPPISPSTGNLPVVETSAPIIPPSSPAPSPPAPCPSVLPSCMKTWITITTCKDNADSNCYCQDVEFTKTVQECVSAWAANNNDVQGALSYLAGICAPHVANNPGIITNVPKTITLVPTPASPSQTSPQPSSPAGTSGAPISPASPAPGVPTSPPVPGNPASPPVPGNPASPPVPGNPASPSAPGNPASPSVPGNPLATSSVANSPVGGTIPPPAPIPVTTIILSQNVPSACPVSQLPDGQPQAPASNTCSSLLVTQVIVPQVGFTTGPAGPGVTSSSVGLAAGSPAPVTATATRGPVGAVPTTFGTFVGSALPTGAGGPIVPFISAAHSHKVSGVGILVAALLGAVLMV
ncbi:MAG: hypothetical protein Q9182_001396 [Xanthomendoza sp. 2 TL-2023]